MTYTIIDHTSDVGLDVVASTSQALFEASAEAMSDLMFGLPTVAATNRVAVAVEAIDLGGLLVAFLSELLFQFEVEGLVFSRFHVSHLEPTRLSAEAWGEAFDGERHTVLEAVKAVTYHNLVVEERGGAWHARFILDL